jgi:hypothetical protein
MGTVVTDIGVEPDADAASATAELLFNSSSWQARLDQARATREKVLAERAHNSDGRVDNMSGPRPWEKAEKKTAGAAAPLAQPEDLAERRRLRALALSDAQTALPKSDGISSVVVQAPEPKLAVVAPLALVLPAPIQVAADLPEAASQVIMPQKAAGPGSRAMLIGTAFALGLGIGLGAVLVPSRAPVPAQSTAPQVAAKPLIVPAPGSRRSADAATGAPITDLSAPEAPVQTASPAVLSVMAGGFAATDATGSEPLVVATVAGAPRAVVPGRGAFAAIADTAPATAALGQAALRPAVLTSVVMPVPGEAVPAAIAYPLPGAGIAPQAYGTTVLTLPRDAGGDPMPDAASLAPAAAPPSEAINPYAAFEVRILAPEGTSDAEVARLAGQMKQAGFTADAGKPLTVKVKHMHVRFYHQSDADAAGAIAASLDAELRNFVGSATPPPAGVIELWVSGKPVTADADPAAVKVSKTKKAAKKLVSQQATAQSKIQALRDRLAAKMKNGDHL